MIGWLKGHVVYRTPTEIILNVSGVGYHVSVPLHVSRETAVGEERELFIYAHMSDSQISLYGFATLEEKEAFQQLLKVHGVGPRAALNILSHLRPEELARVVYHKDTRKLKAIPGIGGKTSERIIMELAKWVEDSGLEIADSPDERVTTGERSDPRIRDALMALEVLGYKRSEMEVAVIKMCRDYPDDDVETVVQRILQQRGASL